MLKIGIVGLPNVGKSTLFKALTREQVNVANFPFATIDPNIGVVKVPDVRLEKLAFASKSKKTITAAIEFVDIAGLVKGAHEGAGLGNQFLSHIREVDAIVEVVRAFEDPDIIHVEGKISPSRDIETIQIELAMADLSTVGRRLEKNEKEIKAGNKIAQEQKMILEKLKTRLENGESAKNANLDYEELNLIKDLNLLTLKPFLFVFNVQEKDLEKENVRAVIEKYNGIPLNLKLEAELSEMSDAERKEFESESRISELIRAAYRLLNLITYFTTGEDETRGWTIKRGWTAPQAGSAIHTDFENKFIKAEVINWNNLLDCGSPSTVSSGQPNCWSAARQKGILRLEGKDYVVRDGDVIEFKI
ncbi:redox-regulated ATPase YchF [Candidatus Azambacteria bacterium RIFCSPLOWO2_01_FULL_44_84]|nr:MAG: redox-regulated ATPase YchF [Candidatus Azambacteria bacterium RIFCSPLOWO2_01_FULL_44_84]